MITSILLALTSFVSGVLLTLIVVAVKVIHPLRTKVEKGEEFEKKVLLLLNNTSNKDGGRWIKDKNGNIVSPLQTGRKGS